MKKIIGALSLLAVFVCAFAGLGYAVLVFFIYGAHPQKDIIIDGLGRTLEASPVFFRWFGLTDRLWAGWRWFAIDMGVMLCCFWLAALFLWIANYCGGFDDS